LSCRLHPRFFSSVLLPSLILPGQFIFFASFFSSPRRRPKFLSGFLVKHPKDVDRPYRRLGTGASFYYYNLSGNFFSYFPQGHGGYFGSATAGSVITPIKVQLDFSPLTVFLPISHLQLDFSSFLGLAKPSSITTGCQVHKHRCLYLTFPPISRLFRACRGTGATKQPFWSFSFSRPSMT